MASNAARVSVTAEIQNPIGKKVVASAAGISDYLARVHDVNGMLGLVRYQLTRINEPDIGIDEFVDPSLGAEQHQVNYVTRFPILCALLLSAGCSSYIAEPEPAPVAISPESVKALTRKVADWQIDSCEEQGTYRALPRKP